MMNKVEIKGNKNHETVGVMLRHADATIKECKIHGHQMGGVLIWANRDNRVSVVNSKIVFNSRVGVHVVGEDANCLIEGNKIEHNQGAGIKIGISNRSTIIRNEIKMNQFGIEVVAGSPFIFCNKIDKNYEHGVYTYSYLAQQKIRGSKKTKKRLLRCDARIKTNLSISGNKETGVFCTGDRNFTIIEHNAFIGYNKKAGIKVQERAHVHVLCNKVTKNLGQGVLLVEKSSAVIEKNEIIENIKANIALGGENSVNTLIVENKIKGGR